MHLFLTRTFQKKFQKLSSDIQEKIEDTLKVIYTNLYIGKKLMGNLQGEFSFRVGKYRIIYFIDKKKNIWIETVSQRKDVY